MKRQRKCQGCKKTLDADLMHKITFKSKSGKIFLNPSSKILGRSAYVYKNKECIKALLKKRTLKNALKTTETKEIEELLQNLIVES